MLFTDCKFLVQYLQVGCRVPRLTSKLRHHPPTGPDAYDSSPALMQTDEARLFLSSRREFGRRSVEQNGFLALFRRSVFCEFRILADCNTPKLPTPLSPPCRRRGRARGSSAVARPRAAVRGVRVECCAIAWRRVRDDVVVKDAGGRRRRRGRARGSFNAAPRPRAV